MIASHTKREHPARRHHMGQPVQRPLSASVDGRLVDRPADLEANATAAANGDTAVGAVDDGL